MLITDWQTLLHHTASPLRMFSPLFYEQVESPLTDSNATASDFEQMHRRVLQELEAICGTHTDDPQEQRPIAGADGRNEREWLAITTVAKLLDKYTGKSRTCRPDSAAITRLIEAGKLRDNGESNK